VKLRGNLLNILGDQLSHAGMSSDDEKGNVISANAPLQLRISDAEDEDLSTHQAEHNISFSNVSRAI
jgi:hypothetical protein